MGSCVESELFRRSDLQQNENLPRYCPGWCCLCFRSCPEFTGFEELLRNPDQLMPSLMLMLTPLCSTEPLDMAPLVMPVPMKRPTSDRDRHSSSFHLTMREQGTVSRELSIMTTMTTTLSAAMTMW